MASVSTIVTSAAFYHIEATEDLVSVISIIEFASGLYSSSKRSESRKWALLLFWSASWVLWLSWISCCYSVYDFRSTAEAYSYKEMAPRSSIVTKFFIIIRL